MLALLQAIGERETGLGRIVRLTPGLLQQGSRFVVVLRSGGIGVGDAHQRGRERVARGCARLPIRQVTEFIRGFSMAAAQCERVGEIAAGGNMGGIQFERRAKAFCRVLRPIERGERIAQIEVVDGFVAFERDRRTDLGDRLRMLAALVRDEAEQVRGIGIACVRAQDRAIALLGAGKIAAFVQPKRRLQCRGAAA